MPGVKSNSSSQFRSQNKQNDPIFAHAAPGYAFSQAINLQAISSYVKDIYNKFANKVNNTKTQASLITANVKDVYNKFAKKLEDTKTRASLMIAKDIFIYGAGLGATLALGCGLLGSALGSSAFPGIGTVIGKTMGAVAGFTIGFTIGTVWALASNENNIKALYAKEANEHELKGRNVANNGLNFFNNPNNDPEQKVDPEQNSGPHHRPVNN